MYLVRLTSPCREPRLVDVTVKVCAKTVWAVTADGRRHLVGSSAFQTLPAAQRCRAALLQKLVDSRYHQYTNPNLVQAAKQVLHTLH